MAPRLNILRVIQCLILGAAASAAGAEPPRQGESKAKEPLRSYSFLHYLPSGYGQEPAKTYPLVIFLHGAGERGTSLDQVRKQGLPKAIEQGRDFPFIVISPQCPKEEWWNLDAVDAFVDEIISRYRVDRDRVYLTGLSMGGYATWALLARRPDRYAAAVPICGGGDPETAARFAHIPLWVFHGAKDRRVPLSQSEGMVQAVKRAGGNPRFTVYPDAGHDSWTAAYAEPELFPWLLSHVRGSK